MNEFIIKQIMPKSLLQIILDARGSNQDEPLNDDEVTELVKTLKEIINHHEGNISSF